MTYVSGNTSKVESMSLPRKALKPDSKVIIIDDFMRGGGTIKGMTDLMTEFGAEVVGTGVFISTTQPEEKMVKNYIDDNRGSYIYFFSRFNMYICYS